MTKPNCLSRSLDQWNEDKSMRLWYNGNHVICIENAVGVTWDKMNKMEGRYLPLESFGTYHFIVKFELSRKHLKLLGEYFNSMSENVKII
jgi:hypothetical protein